MLGSVSASVGSIRVIGHSGKTVTGVRASKTKPLITEQSHCSLSLRTLIHQAGKKLSHLTRTGAQLATIQLALPLPDIISRFIGKTDL